MSAHVARARGHMHLRLGRPQAAVEAFCEVLSHEPEDADTHAFLAIALLGSKRLQAARIEAELAVGIQADGPMPLYALGQVRLAERRWKEAEEVFQQLLAVEPDDAVNHRALAQVRRARGDLAGALAALEKARALDPESPAVLGDIAEVHLEAGRIAEAEAAVQAALELHPEDADALVVMGHLLLRRGLTGEARDHAISVLRHHPDHAGALALLVAEKARSSWLLGLWWRYNTWMIGLGERAIAALLVGFALYRLVQLLARDFVSDGAADLVQLLWLGFAAYTWFGPAWFRRTLDKELQPATLRDDF